ncbi:MAG: hypothetical protein UT55_C0026G0006 [Candidatus Peregrinibacteria bacterium GW2011_GWE2_39_6]|nr:MAG: hypothetical protein UT55_C0026G0006 [Candidatus Peregrinibacteria bacterium GW2011_GWE2_39_6]
MNIANYGGMKSDRYLTHEVHYTIEITNRKDQDGKPLVYGDLEINLRHLGGYNTPLSGDYTGYLRVFLPPGTSLIESLSGQSGDVSLNGYAGWGDFITLHPGEQQTFKYRFKLNADYFLNDAYVLNIIKQPGTLNDFYDVNIKAPLGKKISGNQWENHENVAFYRGFLNQDLELELKFSEDEFGPRLFDQKNAALNIITLSFAESLDTSGATDPLNYQIADLDVNEPGITDSLIIDFIEVDEGTIRIYTKGMTIQPEEHFSVSMRNIRDRNGNYINPNPRAVTVVQRLE